MKTHDLRTRVTWLLVAGAVAGRILIQSADAHAQDTAQVLHTNTGNGTTPAPGLIVGSDGNFYDTAEGYNQVNGSVFSLSADGKTYAVIYPFSGGQRLVSGVVEGGDNALYGTIYSGKDAIAMGAVFKVTKAGVYTTLHAFTGRDGANPLGPLLIASDGTIYGTTLNGGAGVGTGSGTVFAIDPAGTFSTLYDFASDDVTVVGNNPRSRLIFGTDGTIYGTTLGGGKYAGGTVFAIAADNSVTAVSLDATIGTGPHDLLQACDGNIYGRAFGGNGVIFRLNPVSGRLSVLHALAAADGEFDYNRGDGNPSGGGLIEGRNHALYGVAQHGGAHNGTVFELGLDGAFSVILNATVSSPWGLVQGTDGNLYGTYLGGEFGITLPAVERAASACPVAVMTTGAGGANGGGGMGAAGSPATGAAGTSGAAGAGASSGSGGGAAGSGQPPPASKSGGCALAGNPGGDYGAGAVLFVLTALVGWRARRRGSRR